MCDEKVKISKILAEKVKQSGGDTYFVGGYVRDKIMGKKSDDIDIEVHKISPDTLRKILKDTASYSEVGKAFGIFTLNDYHIDIALPRKDIQKGRGHRDIDVCVDPFIGTKRAAKRRDFTINSIMENVLTGQIIDHYNGCKDIKNKLIRHVNDNTFADDPLRILRAAQFAARFNFKIANESIALSKSADLTFLSKERVYDETKKALLKAKKPSLYFENLKLMEHIAPWFKSLLLPQDKWQHAMMNIDEGAAVRTYADNPLGFMMFCCCSLFKKQEEVADFISGITDEKYQKKYVTNLYTQSINLYNAALSKSNIFETNKIFDNTLDREDLILGLRAIYKDDEIVIFAKKRLSHYNKIADEGFLKGRDLIDAGIKEDVSFKDILDNARNLRLQGYSNEQTLNIIKTQIPN